MNNSARIVFTVSCFVLQYLLPSLIILRIYLRYQLFTQYSENQKTLAQQDDVYTFSILAFVFMSKMKKSQIKTKSSFPYSIIIKNSLLIFYVKYNIAGVIIFCLLKLGTILVVLEVVTEFHIFYILFIINLNGGRKE